MNAPSQNRRGVLIGTGYFSDFHLDAWQRVRGAEIVVVCDLDRERAERAAAKYGIASVHTDAAEALQNPDLDFVDLATPPADRLALFRQVAQRGLPVITQKPLADDLATAEQIVATAREAGIRLMVHENFRFQPWYREIRKLLAEGVIGRQLQTLSMQTRLGDGWGPEAYLARQPYFRTMPRLLIHETGIHFIDVFQFLAGPVTEVYAVTRRMNPVIAGEDAVQLTLRFSSGAVGVWDADRYHESTATDPRYTFGRLRVESDRGTLRLDEEGRLWIKPLGEPEREHRYPHERRGFAGDCVLATQQHFIDCLSSGEEFETSGERYLSNLRVETAAYRSAEVNRPVTVEASPRSRGVPARSGGRVIDLTLAIDETLPGAQVTTATTLVDKGWNSTTLTLYSHCGTHMDAPLHFLGEEGASLDQQRLEVCCGPARVIDLTPVEPGELIGVARVRARLPEPVPGERLLLRTDWSKRFGTPDYRDRLPRISVELAQWLVERGVALVGVEPPSVADVNNLAELTEVHQILFRGEIVIVEGLAGLDQIRQPVVEFIALPLKITGGDGSPVRAIAIEPGS